MSRFNEKSNLREQLFFEDEKSKVWWLIAVSLPVVVSFGALTIAKVEQIKQANTPVPSAPVPTSINAVGRLEPRGEVLKLSAPAGVEGSSRVEQVYVKEGERVQRGQVIAILDNFSSSQASVEEARAKLQEARANLANVKAGSPRDIQAQKAVIGRLQAQLAGEKDAQQATIARITAQLNGERIALQATINRIQAEIEGQKDALIASVARVRAEQRNAQVDAQRYEMLYREGAISQQERDKRRLSLETSNSSLAEIKANQKKAIATLRQELAEARANQLKTVATLQQQLIEARVTRDKTVATLQRQIDEERARFNRIQEVRPIDVQIAQAQVGNAIASLRRAEAQLGLSYIKAPIAGEILKIHTKAGESMSQYGIAEMGRTDQMIVVAEVPEDSIGKVRLGQQVMVTSDNGAFDGELQGTVSEIGRKIGKKDVLNTDPAADIDARVVEVKITLSPQDTKRVANLTNAKVVVEIGI
ncbi:MULTISPECIES: HlyD family efflux transporter periplasmic adaptor subunit [Nostocales]|uniref:HlyD family efflux transporter periplasmic adaptor subunit n=4 Tax=Nostocales TaxID=1161 RepID=A0A8S9SVK4_9CYAN|nr:HlyD family efflux transporter periplasmic adaptor subunit [Tolypothrix bouteillei]KAF3884006.1 HlyD family efflux transporter periplasmic adaptor subunit [Tolypothrix bouteillei VB521301]